ncbi:HDOD domain-containing protein [Luteibacter yeojuensis]|uniref:HDOD domain-containing protein n=1 Tax=Luteibacter yeojuensis TaxID=345309 RepID=UPI000698E0F3|nr:HDOD domain-containing protein [Luteibacter yeojuensis]
MIGRFFRKLFGAGTPATPVETEREHAYVAVAVQPPAHGNATAAEEVEDRFYRMLLGVGPSTEPAMTATEQAALRRVRDAFGGERFDVGTLPRLPSVVPQLMRSLRNTDSDSRALAEQIARDTVLVGEIIRVANSAYFRTARPVTGLPQAITLLGQNGLRRVVMQLVMRPILRTDADATSRAAGERLWEHAERCARTCVFLSRPAADAFEAFLAGLVSQTGAQTILLELDAAGLPQDGLSRPFVAAIGQQVERLSLHAARYWEFPSRVVQALAERADPADAGARTPLGRALLAASRVAMLDVLVEQGLAEPDSVLLATAAQGFSQDRLQAAHDDLKAPDAAEA